jgi:hypothetical protein
MRGHHAGRRASCMSDHVLPVGSHSVLAIAGRGVALTLPLWLAIAATSLAVCSSARHRGTVQAVSLLAITPTHASLPPLLCCYAVLYCARGAPTVCPPCAVASSSHCRLDSDPRCNFCRLSTILPRFSSCTVLASCPLAKQPHPTCNRVAVGTNFGVFPLASR